jgi:hypothetical protein
MVEMEAKQEVSGSSYLIAFSKVHNSTAKQGAR